MLLESRTIGVVPKAPKEPSNDRRCHNFADAKMTKVHLTPKHPNY